MTPVAIRSSQVLSRQPTSCVSPSSAMGETRTANCAKLAGCDCRCTDPSARPNASRPTKIATFRFAKGHFPSHLRVTDKGVRVHAKRAQLIARVGRLRAKNEEGAECPLVAQEVKEAI